MEALQQSEVRVPLGGDRVYKDQCVYSFDSPESLDGLYVCLYSFLGFGKDHVLSYCKKTGRRLFLHIKRTKKVQQPVEADKDVAEVKPTRLALGVDGGFDGGQAKEEYEETYSLVILPEYIIITLPNTELPTKVLESINAIIAAENVSKKEAILAWDGEKRPISKHSTLQQLDNGVKIPPSGWKCSKCDLTNNLWINLTDGTVLCGRRYFDGSGGNNHALEHFQQTKYPLCVKLGTITPDGADVYSYDEDTMVEDPNLAQHLAHFGINVALMTKTDQTMTELEIDMNMKIGEWSVIQESGKELELAYGPGYTGMSNLGNSCYLNSVMQVLFTIPEFQLRYYNLADNVFQSMPTNPTDDFEVQMCKLAVGLLSGKYSQQPKDVPMETDSQDGPKQKEQPGIAPYMFKAVVGRGHQEFGSSRQQDAQEFYLHLMTMIDRHQRNVTTSNPVNSFKFELEERVQCSKSGQVKYTTQETCLLTLPVPMATATNKDEVEAWNIKRRQLEEKKERVNPDDIVRAKIPFADCLRAFISPVQIEDFFSTAINDKCTAIKTTRFATFPDYLMIQLNKFTIGDDWVPRKLDVLIDVPQQLMIEEFRGRGLQSGEVELPEGTTTQPAVNIDDSVVSQLVGMGFPLEGCRRAAYHTDGRGIEAAMEWALQHSADPDFATPFTVTKDVSKSSCDEGSISMIESMGFTRSQAITALQATSNNLERAVDWIFSHTDELATMETAQSSGEVKLKDGPGSE